jgi:AraC-like DNA-binding protein
MSSVSAGLVKSYWQFAEQAGMSRAELLRAAGLDATKLDDGAMPISRDAMNGIVHALSLHTRDPALGMRLAEVAEMRMLGFWGYVLMSCLTLRQRVQLQMHYQRLLDHGGRIGLRVEGDQAVLDWHLDVPTRPEWVQDLPLHYDFCVTVACLQQARSVGSERPEMELRLPYREQPHHARLRALVTGPVLFDAPRCQVRLPARELDRRLPGDAYLLELARRELDRRLEAVSRALNGDLPSRVRARLSAALSDDASLPRIARDLRVSARTLSRRLRAAGRSFQELLEEARRDNAVSYLVETDHSIKEIAGRLGYGDPSNFRRAFHRWTGLKPVDYRVKHRSRSHD